MWLMLLADSDMLLCDKNIHGHAARGSYGRSDASSMRHTTSARFQKNSDHTREDTGRGEQVFTSFFTRGHAIVHVRSDGGRGPHMSGPRCTRRTAAK